MKRKFIKVVFTAWASFFFLVMIGDVSAAWYEWAKNAREKLEWDSREVDCRIKVEFEANYDPSISISLDGAEVAVETGVKFRFADGKRIICIDGTTHRDCADIVGFWESWDGEGDCIPGGSEAA